MTDFNPPFAESGPLRAPDATEQSLGIPCGPFDLAMFNYLFNLHQGQFKNIADEAGVSSASEGDKTVLFRAVDALISAATGGNPAGYVLLTQARARLPIFPEILNTDGRIVVTAPSTGTIRIPGGVDFLHRGIFSVTTAQTDLSTDVSKIYHLRWNPDDGFELKDTSSATYNPSSLSESNAAFDSTYDDMLVARIVTNSSNVATIANLSNLPRLSHRYAGDEITLNTGAEWGTLSDTAQELNWARTPIQYDPKLRGISSGPKDFDEGYVVGYGSLGVFTFREASATRYGTSDLEYTYDDTNHNNGRVSFAQDFLAV